MDPRDLARSQARGRVAIGTALVLAPGLAGRMWIGDDAARRAVKVFTRALGVRDLAIGLGVLLALDRDAPVRGWLEAGTLSDAVDVAATLLAGRAIPADARNAAVLVAGGSALTGAALARRLGGSREGLPIPRGPAGAHD